MFRTLKKRILPIFLIIPLNVLTDDIDQNIANILQVNAEDAYLTRLVTAISERAHYSQSRIDNESSIKILTEYIDTLDRNKMYFSQSDIIYFQRYKYQLDDSLRDGELRPIFDIFSTYRLRVQQRLDHSLQVIGSIENFDSEEEFQFKNTKNKWKYD